MDPRIAQVANHPLHRHLGIEQLESTDGHGRLSVTVGKRTVNPAGVFLGGVLYMVCDVCAYVGLLSRLDAATEAVTHDIHVSVMRGARPGEVVVFDSIPARLGRRIAFIDVNARVASRIIAQARVTKTLLAA